MVQRLRGFAGVVFAGMLCAAGPVHAEAKSGDTLKIVNNPGGGQVVYGSIEQRHTPQSGMAFMLQMVHGHFGNKPQVSKVFQVRNSESYAAFFTLIAKNEGGKAIAGEVIVTAPKGGQPAAAVLYDDAPRFAKSQPALMRTLNGAWHAANPVQADSSAPAAARAAPVSAQAAPALRMQTAGDRSAAIGLPEGWRLLSVSGGQVTAEGPNGERIGLGLLIQQIRDPRSRQSPFMPPARGGIVCPAGGDLFNAYVCVVNQQRQRQNLPAASFTLTRARPLPGTGKGQPDIEAIFDLDLHDGKGLRSASARIGALYTPGLPTWAMAIQNSSLPKTVAAAEASTMTAIIGSYRQNAQVINSELQQRLGEIRAVGERSKIQAQAADQRRIASASAFDAHMDDIDRGSKAMQNYTFDRSQIQDNDLQGRATVSNGLADALVQADPNRYQIIPTASFLKGVDY